MNFDRIGFAGIGTMGMPMSANISRSGRRVLVWDDFRHRMDEVNEPNISKAASRSDLISRSDVIFVMLSTFEVIIRFFFGCHDQDSPAIASSTGEKLFVIMSSISVQDYLRLEEKLRPHGVRLFDAPVSGGEKGAQAGSLTIFAAGTPEDYRKLEPTLVAMGRPNFMGKGGNGQLTKIGNQIIVASSVIAIAEAMHLIQRSGLDLQAFVDALAGGFADSAILKTHGRRILQSDFTPGGNAFYQLKDIESAQEQAKSLDISLPLLDRSKDIFSRMIALGLGELDHSGVIEVLRRSSVP